MFEKINIFTRRHLLVIVIVCFILLVIAIFLTMQSKPGRNGKVQTLPEKQGQTTQEEEQDNAFMVDPKQIERARQSSYQQYVKDGRPTPSLNQSGFEFELAPNLQKKKTSQAYVLAASSCTPDSAPNTVPIYTLKHDWDLKEAQKVAQSFDLDPNPSSLPITGGYEYYFTNPQAKGFLSFITSSGMYTYHRILSPTGPDITVDQASQLMVSEMEKHSIPQNLVSFIGSKFDPANNYFIGVFQGNWPPFKVTDQQSLEDLGTSSVCGVSDAKTVNDIEIYLTKDGQLAKFIMQTRTKLDSLQANREELEDALKEYKNELPITPIIVGQNDAKISGKILIDEATLEWYDFGDIFSQKIYLPMYVAGGTATLQTGKQARVIVLVPAVSKKDLEKKGLIRAAKHSLQLASFTPTPTKPPPPPPPPPKPTGAPPPPGGAAAGCPGGKVDYFVRCDNGGSPVCQNFMESTSDLYGVCNNGCQSKEGSVTVSQGDPCTEFYNQLGIPGTPAGSSTKKDGTFHCILNSCPC